MKNKKLIGLLAITMISGLILSQAVLAAPPGPPPTPNSPAATFSSMSLGTSDLFTSGAWSGVSRWGIFSQPNYLTLGLPNAAGKGLKVTLFNANSTSGGDYLKIDSNGTDLNTVLNANGNAANSRLAALTSYCGVVAGYATPGYPGGTFSMISNPNPCTIEFNLSESDPAGTCSALAGTYTAINKRCSWAEPGYVPNSTFCMFAGSPSPYVSGGNCIWTPTVANLKGGVDITGPISNTAAASAVQVTDAQGLIVSASDPDTGLYMKPPTSLGAGAEIGFKDSIDNDSLSIVSPRSISLLSNTDDHPDMGLQIYDSYYKPGSPNVYGLVMNHTASDGLPAPLKFSALNVDTVYNVITGTPNGNLDENGQSVGITANGDRAGIMTTSWHGGLAAQPGTYSNGGGKSFRSLGIYALGNTTGTNSGGGLFEVLGGTIYTALAWRDASSVQWAMYANGNIGVNGTASKTGGGSWTVLSDERLKDIKDQFTRGLSDLMQINPVAFSYKKDNPKELLSDKTFIGVVAQDVQKAIPEAVNTDETGYLTVNNDPIIWTMVNSIKELKLQNDKLAEQNADLENRLATLEAQLK